MKRKRQTAGGTRRRGDQRSSRVLRIPAADGMRSVAVPGVRDASLVGRYWNAVHKYIAKGDVSALEPFIDARITDASGNRVPLLTDLTTLDRLAGAGVLSFESIYRRTA